MTLLEALDIIYKIMNIILIWFKFKNASNTSPPMYNRNLYPNERRTPLKKLEKGTHKGGGQMRNTHSFVVYIKSNARSQKKTVTLTDTRP